MTLSLKRCQKFDTDTDNNQSETEDDVVIERSLNKLTLEACAMR